MSFGNTDVNQIYQHWKNRVEKDLAVRRDSWKNDFGSNYVFYEPITMNTELFTDAVPPILKEAHQMMVNNVLTNIKTHIEEVHKGMLNYNSGRIGDNI
jgi:hypothetical protein